MVDPNGADVEAEANPSSRRAVPMTERSGRRAWSKGPAETVNQKSWLSLDDDELLHRIGTLAPDLDVDQQLLEVVRSDRHFYIRQEAAKRIRDREALFPFENDRHIGQIVVRHLNRHEDLEYLAKLAARGRYGEVRMAAQVQLRRLRERLHAPDGPDAVVVENQTWRVAALFQESEMLRLADQALPRPEFEVADLAPGPTVAHVLEQYDPHLVVTDLQHVFDQEGFVDTVRRRPRYVPLVVLCPSDQTDPLIEVLDHGADELVSLPVDPAVLTAKIRALLHFAHRRIVQDERSDVPPALPPPAADSLVAVQPPSEATPTDGTLLGWAVHFIVEPTWIHLGTHVTWMLLKRTRADLLDRHPTLKRFAVDSNARVNFDLSKGPSLPSASVAAVAAWMAAFLAAARHITVDAMAIDVRRATGLMAKALEHVGFYREYDAAVHPGDTRRPAP